MALSTGFTNKVGGNETASHEISQPQSDFSAFADNPDFQALEEALRRVLQLRMTATIEEVVQVAAEAFAYPFGIARASRCLCLSGRYRIRDGIVEPTRNLTPIDALGRERGCRASPFTRAC